MPLTLELSTPPTIEPVTVPDVKAHLRIDIGTDDALLGVLITTAREEIERYLRRQIMPATWKLYLDGFPSVIRLPRPPVSSVTSITYLDTDGVSQTLATTEYQTDLISEPARITTAESKIWPSTQGGTYNTVTVTYVSGYTSIANVPTPIKVGIQMMAGDLYEHRESTHEVKVEQNMTLMRMLWLYRILEAF